MKTVLFAVGMLVLGACGSKQSTSAAQDAGNVSPEPVSVAQGYVCTDGQDSIQISLDSANKLTFSDASTLATAGEFNCLPKGSGGSLYVGASGPNSWGYRVPSNILAKPSRFDLQFAWDEDSDGNGCEFRKISCVAN